MFVLLFLESFSEDEWNLLYVAVTRAKKRLIMTKSLENILTLAGVREMGNWSSFPTVCGISLSLKMRVLGDLVSAQRQGH